MLFEFEKTRVGFLSELESLETIPSLIGVIYGR